MIGVFAVIGVVVGAWLVLRKKDDNRRDYSLGLPIAKEIQSLIKKKKYDLAEQKVKKQNLNDITQIVDHLALSLNEKEILKWNETSNNDFSVLALGTFYLHSAWIARSHAQGEDVSEKRAAQFFEYLQLSDNTFEKIPDNSFFQPELCARRIRLYMSFSDEELATENFKKISTEHPELIWPYIHYAEMIQPKWGGEISKIERFVDELPQDFLIQSIVQLKLIFDSIVIEDNYFKAQNNSIDTYAKEKLLAIDETLNSTEISSIHKFILYNYMEQTADCLNLKKLKSKYRKMAKDHYTIYPYGLVM